METSAAPTTPSPGQPATPVLPQDGKAPSPSPRAPARGNGPRSTGDQLADAANAALHATSQDATEGVQDSTEASDTDSQGSESTETGTGDESMHEVTIDGKKSKVTLAELKRGYGHNKVATQRLQEAAQIREQNKKFSGIFESIRSTPENFWQLGDALGLDTRKMAAEIVLQEMRRESLTPEQRELEDLREFKKTQETERQKAERERAEREASESEVANLERTADSYASFFESKNMSPNLDFQERFLTLLVASYDRPEGPMKMEEAYARTQKWEQRQKASKWDNLTEDEIASMPANVRSTLRKSDVAAMRRSGPQGRPAPQKSVAAPVPPQGTVSTSDAFDSIRQQLLGRK